MKKYITGILFLISLITVGQSIEKDWKFESIKNNSGVSLVNVNPSDSFSLKDGEFNYSLLSKDSLVAKGSYIHQNNILTLNYSLQKEALTIASRRSAGATSTSRASRRCPGSTRRPPRSLVCTRTRRSTI